MNINRIQQTQILFDYMRAYMRDLTEDDLMDKSTVDRIYKEAQDFRKRHKFDIDPIHSGYWIVRMARGYTDEQMERIIKEAAL